MIRRLGDRGGIIDLNSILNSVKKVLGIEESYTHFDADIIMHINTTFSVLTQLGVGPESGFSIDGVSQEWEEFMGNDNRLHMVKSFVALKVRLLFDPPLSSAAVESIKQQIDEMTWRIQVAAENKTGGET